MTHDEPFYRFEGRSGYTRKTKHVNRGLELSATLLTSGGGEELETDFLMWPTV